MNSVSNLKVIIVLITGTVLLNCSDMVTSKQNNKYKITGRVIQYSPYGLTNLGRANVIFESNLFSRITETNADGNFFLAMEKIPENFTLKISKQGYGAIDTLLCDSSLTLLGEFDYGFERPLQLAKYIDYFNLKLNFYWEYIASSSDGNDNSDVSSCFKGIELWHINYIAPDTSLIEIQITSNGVITYVDTLMGVYTRDINNVLYSVKLSNTDSSWQYLSCVSGDNFDTPGLRILKKFGLPSVQLYSGEKVDYLFSPSPKDTSEWSIQYNFGFISARVKLYDHNFHTFYSIN